MANCKMINGWPYSVMVSSSPDNFAIFFNGQSGCRQYTVAQRFHGASTNIHWTECCEKKKLQNEFKQGDSEPFFEPQYFTKKHQNLWKFVVLPWWDSSSLWSYGFLGGHVGRNRSSPQSGPGEACGKKSSPPPQKSKTFGVGKKNRGKHGNAHVVKGNTCSKRHLKTVQVSPVINSYTAIFLFQVFFLKYILPVRIISFQLNPVVLKLTNVGAAHEQ